MFIFAPDTNRKNVYNYLGNLFSKSFMKNLDAIFNLSRDLTEFPYICILPQTKVQDEYMKVRLDILDKNLVLRAPLK